MMFSIADQLKAISCHASRLAAEKKRHADEHQARLKQRKAAQDRAWATRRDSGKFARTGLAAAVLVRLPAGEQNALLLSQVEVLLEDVPHAPTGLSATLVNLVKQDLVCRIGERRQFRYFKP
jgi:hypothetical protein